MPGAGDFFGGVGDFFGDVLGKPDVEGFEDISDQLFQFAQTQQNVAMQQLQRQQRLEDPLRAQLFGTGIGLAPGAGGGVGGGGASKGPGGGAGGGGVGGGGAIGQFLATGALPQALSVQRQFAPAQEAIAQQGQQVRGGILSRIPARGGQLNQLLGQQRISEGQQQGQLQNQIAGLEMPIRQGLFDAALRTAVGQPFPVASTLAGASSSLAGGANVFGQGQGLMANKKSGLGNTGVDLARLLMGTPPTETPTGMPFSPIPAGAPPIAGGFF